MFTTAGAPAMAAITLPSIPKNIGFCDKLIAIKVATTHADPITIRVNSISKNSHILLNISMIIDVFVLLFASSAFSFASSIDFLAFSSSFASFSSASFASSFSLCVAFSLSAFSLAAAASWINFSNVVIILTVSSAAFVAKDAAKASCAACFAASVFAILASSSADFAASSAISDIVLFSSSSRFTSTVNPVSVAIPSSCAALVATAFAFFASLIANASILAIYSDAIVVSSYFYDQ